MGSLSKFTLGNKDLFNKNTRTLGAGDYPALKFFFIFIFKSARKIYFFCFVSRSNSKFVARPRLAGRVA